MSELIGPGEPCPYCNEDYGRHTGICLTKSKAFGQAKTMKPEECLSRLRAMLHDAGDTWDLSPHDKMAISWALCEHKRLLDLFEKAGNKLQELAGDMGQTAAWMLSGTKR